VPQIVSRPEALFRCLVRGDGGDSDAASSDSAMLLPLASFEVLQGAGVSASLERRRSEPHATDDLEAAVETIEHAKARVRTVAMGGRRCTCTCALAWHATDWLFVCHRPWHS
jgi:hypothetical protein